MAHINTLSAGMYTDLAVAVDAAQNAAAIANPIQANLVLAFVKDTLTMDSAALAASAVVGEFTRIKNVREFPSIGTPPNIVNVPVFGQKTSSQIQGQSDAPSMELTINYIPAEWAEGTVLGDMVGDGTARVFRVALLNSAPTGSGADQYASTVGGLGTVKNTEWYFVGKIEALLVNPQLTDANTATLTLSAQSDFIGAFTL